MMHSGININSCVYTYDFEINTYLFSHLSAITRYIIIPMPMTPTKTKGLNSPNVRPSMNERLGGVPGNTEDSMCSGDKIPK